MEAQGSDSSGVGSCCGLMTAVISAASGKPLHEGAPEAGLNLGKLLGRSLDSSLVKTWLVEELSGFLTYGAPRNRCTLATFVSAQPLPNQIPLPIGSR